LRRGAQNLANFIKSIFEHSDAAADADYDRRIHLFGELSGILKPFDYHGPAAAPVAEPAGCVPAGCGRARIARRP
jgi:hypothetical protein